MRYCLNILFLLLLFTNLSAQGLQTDSSQFQMKFPAIYFKHGSVDFAKMPYTADSCYRYIAEHANDIHEYVIWRDSAEAEDLMQQRIAKLKTDLLKEGAKRISIHSMQGKQKISGSTISKEQEPAKKEFLITLNSVFEISQTHLKEVKKGKKSHIDRPRWWCPKCHKRHAFRRQRQMGSSKSS